ncbi:sulfite exporter TauE/SafE family protein [Nocardioides sp.]|uniref:sulfite exporter TauE/SafE family protein n=1 Tax=Nocardioides sp. TaxID=35761 RepID=UPI00351820C0
MGPLEAAASAAAGLGAGTINAVVGSGTLLTFPTLLAVGVPPVVANVSNNIGLVPGAVTGALGYRRELRGQGALVRRLLPASVLGGLLGAVLLLTLPPGAFEAIVPVLVLLGLLLVVLQPRLSAAVADRAAAREAAAGATSEAATSTRGDAGWVRPAVFATGIYGGYFGAAQGVLLMGVLGSGVPQDLQRSNGLKNVLAGAVNGVAGLVYAVVADVDWTVVALLAVGSVLGGVLGARVGRRLPPVVLRVVIVVVGLAALTAFLLT